VTGAVFGALGQGATALVGREFLVAVLFLVGAAMLASVAGWKPPVPVGVQRRLGLMYRSGMGMLPGRRALAAGLLTPLLPCALSGSAYALSVGAGTASVGAAVMAVFSIASSPGLVLGHGLLAWMRRFFGAVVQSRITAAFTVAAALLLMRRGWMLGQGGAACH